MNHAYPFLLLVQCLWLKCGNPSQPAAGDQAHGNPYPLHVSGNTTRASSGDYATFVEKHFVIDTPVGHHVQGTVTSPQDSTKSAEWQQFVRGHGGTATMNHAYPFLLLVQADLHDYTFEPPGPYT
ncbi:hypothetical protein HPB47_025802 [Ixodes persulcatus]|uniref:Uncharacterized protein n=1 Tax=Ixodes persulcatus TaxID=34615 RepID=A0AC60Q2C8_IXOPE|nr:hypothetical protein HPB47_025802 [Ixodes persulcatus]